jgi:hypothetical protein
MTAITILKPNSKTPLADEALELIARMDGEEMSALLSYLSGVLGEARRNGSIQMTFSAHHPRRHLSTYAVKNLKATLNGLVRPVE